MIYIKSEENNLYQKMENFEQKKQKIYQISLHKTSKLLHYSPLLIHKYLNILISILLQQYLLKLQKNICQKKQLLNRLYWNIFPDLLHPELVLNNLQNPLTELKSTSFKIHQINESLILFKSLWASLFQKVLFSRDIFDTPTGMPKPVYFLGARKYPLSLTIVPSNLVPLSQPSL